MWPHPSEKGGGGGGGVLYTKLVVMCVLYCVMGLCIGWFSGVGSKRNRDEQWIENQDAFDKILAGLNAVQGGSTQGGDILEPSGSKTLVESAIESKKIV